MKKICFHPFRWSPHLRECSRCQGCTSDIKWYVESNSHNKDTCFTTTEYQVCKHKMKIEQVRNDHFLIFYLACQTRLSTLILFQTMCVPGMPLVPYLFCASSILSSLSSLCPSPSFHSILPRCFVGKQNLEKAIQSAPEYSFNGIFSFFTTSCIYEYFMMILS